jgi:hypothetical protein
VRTVLRERFGEKVEMRFVPPARPGLLARLFGRQPFGPQSLLDMPEMIGAIEERSAWARLGL